MTDLIVYTFIIVDKYLLMENLIIHIPHSSTAIPLKSGYLVSDSILQEEIYKLTDWYTDDLFSSKGGEVLIAPFSRIFCDVERFADDQLEVMSKFGMGALYEVLDDGTPMRILTDEEKKIILEEYYWQYHRKFIDIVELQLSQYGRAVIIDCHSFANTPLLRDINKNENRPDINIGVDEFHTPDYLKEFSRIFFELKGYSVGINWPYQGSIVPYKFYRQDKTVQSILVEVNKSLYLDDGSLEKSDNYFQIKGHLQEYLREVRNAICEVLPTT